MNIVLDIAILVLLQMLGLMLGQIGKVCYEVLPCPDDEKEKPVFRKENFKYDFSLLFGIPTMIIFPLLYLKYGFSVEFYLFALASLALVPIMAVDFKHYIIPDKLNLFIAVLGVIYVIYLFATLQTDLAINHILGGIIGGGIFLLLALISLAIYRQEGMGFGDIKLMTGLGLIFGIKSILVLTLIAFVLSAVICVGLLITRVKSMKEYIPFGPFICIGAFALMFVPAGFFVDWYLNMLVR